MTPEQELPIIKEQIRQTLHDFEPYYAPGNTVADELQDKYFTGVVGPFKTGKTFLTTKAMELEPEITPINTTTTRGRKDEDPEGFKTNQTFMSFRDAVNDGSLVNYSVIPGADIYGTYPDDFTAPYNIGPFLPSSIPQIERAGFKNHRFIYIVTAGELWRSFVEAGRSHMDKERFKSRIYESIDSTQFALEHLDTFNFVENTYEEKGTKKAARQISQLALFHAQETIPQEDAKILLEQMRATAIDLAR